MSTRNRERRRAKKLANQRAQRSGRRPDRGNAPPYDEKPLFSTAPDQFARELVDYAVNAVRVDDAEALGLYLGALSGRPDDRRWRHDVDRALLTTARAELRAAWVRGWQPADLVRLAKRQLGEMHARMLVDVIAAEMRPFAANTVDARWAAQVDRLGATQWWTNDDLIVDGWRERERLDRRSVIHRVLELRNLLGRRAYKLAQLCPLPGSARRGSLLPDRVAPDAFDQRILARVRGLLAKAESTEFTEEADALTAKAQELMARHSIDYALLAAAKPNDDKPGGIRVYIDNPYETAKCLLLQVVAEANRCRAIWAKDPGFSTVVGYPADLEATEMLYTSLLVQASAAMTRQGSRKDAYGRSRTRSFRQSFLDAFAIRIGERLMAATEATSRQAATEDGSDRLLPVLAARTDKVKEVMEEMFPATSSSAVKMGNLEGWASGTAAANLAAIQARKAVADAE